MKEGRGRNKVGGKAKMCMREGGRREAATEGLGGGGLVSK